MAAELPTTNGDGPQTNGDGKSSNFAVKAGLARMLKGGVIMDVVNAEQVCWFFSLPILHANALLRWRISAVLDIPFDV